MQPHDYDYVIAYEDFMNKFKVSEITGSEVGEVVMRMAGYYTRYNLGFHKAIKAFSAVKASLLNGLDEQTGKPMSSAKADTMADATPEGEQYELYKIHVQNIQEYINSLKALQRSLTQEFLNN